MCRQKKTNTCLQPLPQTESEIPRLLLLFKIMIILFLIVKLLVVFTQPFMDIQLTDENWHAKNIPTQWWWTLMPICYCQLKLFQHQQHLKVRFLYQDFNCSKLKLLLFPFIYNYHYPSDTTLAESETECQQPALVPRNISSSPRKGRSATSSDTRFLASMNLGAHNVSFWY